MREFVLLDKFLLVLTIIAARPAFGQERRPKTIDETYTRLIPFTEVPLTCDSSDNVYGLINGGLEKCENFLKEDKTLDNREDYEYEKYKCKHLRVHGKLNDNHVCECEHNWKGPICNQYNGCPEGYSLHNGVMSFLSCTPNVCQHDGELAIGTKHIECICKAPWDGRWCERLACWRMAPREHERRWRNAVDHCRCADGYEGENCEMIVFCKNGELVGGRCECAEGYKGEICDRKCIPNQTCSAGRNTGILALMFAIGFSTLFVTRNL